MTRKAFTLIELLVVIAIIAILAAILFPVFAQAREKARQTACVSNEKQIGLAIVQYQQDYDELMPGGANYFGTGNGWAYQVYPYIKSKQAFLCPNEANGGAINYCFNSNLVFYPSTNWTPMAPSGINVAKMTAPGRTVMLCEVTGAKGVLDLTLPIASSANSSNSDWWFTSGGLTEGRSPAGRGYGGTVTTYDPNGMGTTTTLKYTTGSMQNAYAPLSANVGVQAAQGWHQNGANFAFADGHVKYLLPTAVWAGTNNTTAGDCGAVAGKAANTAATTCNGGPVVATFSAS